MNLFLRKKNLHCTVHWSDGNVSSSSSQELGAANVCRQQALRAVERIQGSNRFLYRIHSSNTTKKLRWVCICTENRQSFCCKIMQFYVKLNLIFCKLCIAHAISTCFDRCSFQQQESYAITITFVQGALSRTIGFSGLLIRQKDEDQVKIFKN